MDKAYKGFSVAEKDTLLYPKPLARVVPVDDEVGKQVLFVFLGPHKATIKSRKEGDNWHPFKVYEGTDEEQYVTSFRRARQLGVFVCLLIVFFIFKIFTLGKRRSEYL